MTSFNGARLEEVMSDIAATLEDFQEILSKKSTGNYLVKNAAESVKFRNEGNKLFKCNNHNAESHKATLLYYSKSIALAPANSEELALAYGNRSALLFHLGKYEICIQDINRAIRISSSSSLLTKLEIRKIDCFERMKKPISAKTYEETVQLLGTLDINDAKRLKYEQTLKGTTTFKSLELNKCVEKKISVGIESNEIPCAADGITIQYNEKYGRHVVAKRNIRPGEILVIEKPYVTFPYIHRIHTNCSHCLIVSLASIPCDTCAYAMYCSENCKNEAWNLYHDVECVLMPRMWDVEKSHDGHLKLASIRLTIIAIRKAGSIQKLRNDLKSVNDSKDPRTRGFVNGKYCSDEYRSIYSLTEEMSTIERNFAMILIFSATSSLCMLAKYTNFLAEETHCNVEELMLNDDALFVGALMNRNEHLLHINSHGFADWKQTTESIFSLFKGLLNDGGCSDLDFYGQAIMPFCSLINHSCDPNILRLYTSDQKVVIISLKPIEKDAQLFDTYGLQFSDHGRDDRLEFLELKYKFTCDCIACIEDWPLGCQLKWADLPDKKLMAEIEHRKKKLVYAIFAYRQGDKKHEMHTMEEFISFIEFLMKYLPQPSAELFTTITEFALTLADMYAFTEEDLDECMS